MRKNGLKRIVTTVIAAATIGSFSSLGVSAATINMNTNDYYKTIANNPLNTGLIMNTSNVYNFSNMGLIKIGGINLNNSIYGLTPSNIMEIGNAILNNKNYTTNSIL